MYVLGSLWSIVYRSGDRALERGTSLAVRSAALELYPPLEGDMAACLHFCLVVPFISVRKDNLFYFGLQFSLIVLCGICDGFILNSIRML